MPTHCTNGLCHRFRPVSSSQHTYIHRNQSATRLRWSASSGPYTSVCLVWIPPCICCYRAASAHCLGSSNARTWDAPQYNTLASRCNPVARQPADVVSTALEELHKRNNVNYTINICVFMDESNVRIGT